MILFGRQSKVRTCCWINVSVANGGHGDDTVVNGGGDGGEARVIVGVGLNVVAEAPNEEAGDAHQEDQQTKLLVAVLQSVGDSLQAG